MSATSLMQEDLARSGLVAEDLNARPIDSAERAATSTPYNVDGYVIPYYHIDGRPLPFYRVKLFDHDPKYKQPANSLNHVYFPPNFYAKSAGKSYVIITEGEKKANVATKLGFPAIAFGGVDSWRNRTVMLPPTAELSQIKAGFIAKLPAGTEIHDDTSSSFASGLQELIDFIIKYSKHVIIIYDTDTAEGCKPPVQRAAAALAFELRFRGIAFNHIRQLILPSIPNAQKTGLDDYFQATSTSTSTSTFQHLLQETLRKRSCFPRHPQIREFISRRMQKSRLSRKEYQALAMCMIADLDSDGQRMRSQLEGQTYYFDNTSSKLMRADLVRKDVHDTMFGQHLYRKFGISIADKNLFEWLGAQFTGEEPITEVSPYRIFARPNHREDCVYYQISDSRYVRVNKDGLTFFNNGENQILFESDQVEPLDEQRLQSEFVRQQSNSLDKPLPNFWGKTLQSVRLRDQNKHRLLLSLLYYISPWLYRWRNTQLPIEMILGEAGSGKSTLCELRLSILTGRPLLRNAPQDLKDWHASITNSGGLHVTDNVQLIDRQLRQRLSDDICRIITEPTPFIEMRKYYTHADLVRIPVRLTFCITAIQQPFQNADIIQRSLITDLEKMPSVSFNNNNNTPHSQPHSYTPIEVRYDAEWRAHQLEKYNGREGWVAHHLLALQRFFQLVHQHWIPSYQAKFRLINVEQSLTLMAQVFGMPHEWIPSYLAQTADAALTESDWTFEGLRNYSRTFGPHLNGSVVTASDISEWAREEEDYEKCEILVNARRLGRYMQTHKTMIAQIIGLVEYGTKNNRASFRYIPPPPPPAQAD